MESPVIKRSIVLSGHKTSVSMEEEFWQSLKGIAKERDEMLSTLVSAIDAKRSHNNLSSAIRLYVLAYYKELAARRER